MTENPGQRFMSAAAREDWPVAEAALRDLLKSAPDNPSLHYNLALVLRRQGRAESALEAVRACLVLSAAHQGARFEKAACLMDLGYLREAEAAFTAYLDTFPDDPGARGCRARLRLRLGEPQKALEDCEKALKGNPELSLSRAEALGDLGRVEEAEAILFPFYRSASRLRPAILKIIGQGPDGGMPFDTGVSG
ncbi:tetratricopeptide repeat protein [Breoghania corrubedonensis]|uniref:Tetratricopeptide repeat protein n=1 Tax=Breoghania corrubedonensis TaxID=665038 RepID=A0A2T5VFE2_9HYPH|nr:tetratricopeptide repeat protein [Breoghania corrubedonensis]PTW62472.1 tetratricopeptide repeat protein [Breoghania corrubedonensis]